MCSNFNFYLLHIIRSFLNEHETIPVQRGASRSKAPITRYISTMALLALQTMFLDLKH